VRVYPVSRRTVAGHPSPVNETAIDFIGSGFRLGDAETTMPISFKLGQLGHKLRSEDVAERRRAAARLLKYAEGRTSLEAVRGHLAHALSDADEDVRRGCAQALVLQALRAWLHEHTAKVVYLALASEDPQCVQRVRDALVEAAPGWREPKDLASGLLPFLVDSLSVPERKIRVAAVLALEKTLQLGVDTSSSVSGLVSALNGRDTAAAVLVAHMLWETTTKGKEIPHPFLSALETTLSHPHKDVRYYAAAVLAWRTVLGRSPSRVDGLLLHADPAVRAGAITAISMATRQGTHADALVGALAKAVGDPAGGVAWEAIRTLRAAAEAGADVSEAVDALQSQLHTKSYGWRFGHDLAGTPVAEEDVPARDAAAVLAIHYLNVGDPAGVQTLLRHDYLQVVWGAKLGVRSIHITDPELAHRVRAWLEEKEPR
jgi:hypothetical protein